MSLQLFACCHSDIDLIIIVSIMKGPLPKCVYNILAGINTKFTISSPFILDYEDVMFKQNYTVRDAFGVA